MAGNQQTASVVLNDTTVIDAKPLRTLTPMFPAPLGMHTFTPKSSPSVVCVSPFGPYAGGADLGMPAGVPPVFPSAPADPHQAQPYMVHMNGVANANGTANNTMVTLVLQTPPVASTQESGKKKRGRPKRVQDTTVPSVPPVHLVPADPPVHLVPADPAVHLVPADPPVNLVPSVPSAPPEGNDIVLQTPPSAISHESGKRKRGRPRRVPDVSVLPTPSAPVPDVSVLPTPSVPVPDVSVLPTPSVPVPDVSVLPTPSVRVPDGKPVSQTPPASSVHESGTNKRGRPKRVQDSSDTPTPTKKSEPFMQTPSAVTSLEDGKRKRGRPKRVPDSSVTASSHSGLSIDADTGDTSKRGRPRKIDTTLLHLPSLSSDDPRESVDNVLMMFDALRRRLMQLDEVKQVAKQQHNMKAGSIMMSSELRVNKNKRIGEVSGVEVGDMFYFRIEMCLVGLNSQSMAGIDYMSAKFGNEEDPVAICVVSSGMYENTEDDPEVLVYAGHGMSGKDDQKLERGNLALERSLHRGNPVRVVRSVKDLTCSTGKIYIYDGLYKIREAWVEKGKSGFNVFKHKLLREPGQPDGIAVWKKTEKWRENPSSRDRVISHDISHGMESKPVCLVNEVDDEKGPSHFTYTTKLNYMNSPSSMRKMQGCKCTSVCLPGDNNCSCTHRHKHTSFDTKVGNYQSSSFSSVPLSAWAAPGTRETKNEPEKQRKRGYHLIINADYTINARRFSSSMGLLDQLWDDTVAGPRPDHGLGKLRKYASFSPSSTTAASGAAGAVPSADVAAAPAVTRSITILRPPALSVTSPRSESSSAPSSPASVPDSPFGGTATTPRGEGWSKFRRKGRMAADGTDVASSPGTPRSPTVYDWVVISSLDR